MSAPAKALSLIRRWLALVVVLLSPWWCFAEDIAFRRHVINADSEFMSAAVFDVNKDGKLDIVCGGYWYEAPSWKKHFLRKVEVFGGRPDGYAHQVLDVNGDGWPDLITVNWRSASIKWIEHPGADLAKGQEWKAHVIATPGSSETGRLVDLLGDGTPVLLPCGANFAAWWDTRAAAHEGILPGGGVALLRASEGLKPKDLTSDEETGYNIVVRACKSPIVQIVQNAGENGEVVANKVLENKTAAFGYDARKGVYCDMVKEGIIDPTKVVRSALQNAASVATLLLTSDALIADAPKEEKKSAPGGGGMEDMY